MKKWIALLFTLALCLSLAACTEENSKADDDDYIKKTDRLVEKAELYEKYEELIDALENKDYPGVINHIASLSHADKEAGKEPGPEPVQLLCQQWFTANAQGTVRSLTFRADGSCTVDGYELTWTENDTQSTRMSGYILGDGAVKYCFELSLATEDRSLPHISLWTARENEYGIGSDEHLGNFYNHEMIPVMADYWRQLTMFEDMPEYLSIQLGYVYISDVEFLWTPADASDALLTANAYSRKGDVSTEYTLELKERDGCTVLLVTNGDTGTQALYYSENNGENSYDPTWPEAIYRQARSALTTYARGYSIYVNEQHLSGNSAATYVYGLFSQIEGYLDCADYLARFTVLPSQLTNIYRIDVNQLDQESRSDKYYCWYTADGRLEYECGDSVIERYGITSGNKNYFTYDASGRIESIRVGWSSTDVSAVATPTYDEAGRLVSMAIQTSSESYTASFTYDDLGRIVSMQTHTDDYYGRTYTYVYDDAGQLMRKVWTSQNNNMTVTEDYTYTDGLLTEINATWKYRYSDPYTVRTVFTNDAQGRPVSAAVTSTDPNYTYKSTTLEYVYQDIYFLDTAGLVESE